MEKALLSFAALSDGNLLARSQAITTSLTGNPDFPTTVPAIADVADMVSNFAEALAIAASGNRAAIADKNEKKQALIETLRQLAANITSTANGDRTMLLTTGFDISKEREPVVITKPENLQVTNGMNAGDLVVSVNAVKGAKAYMYEYTTDATQQENSWVATTSSKSKITFSDLEAGKTYYCRVAAVGAKGQIVYTDPVSRIVI